MSICENTRLQAVNSRVNSRVMSNTLCSFPGCDRPMKYAGKCLCDSHYHQAWDGVRLRPIRPRGRIDLAGQRFGKLTAVCPVGQDRGKHIVWLCRCDCGGERMAATPPLTGGAFTSCGCDRKSVTHGDTRSREHGIWKGIIVRCTNSKRTTWPNYGGRGIKICERWRRDYAAFLADMGRAPSTKHSIDRIDVDGDYEPENCRWATPTEQARNTRRAKARAA